jgi:hypothetical protein
MTNKKTANSTSTLAYVMGGMSFFPLIGVVFGIVAIALGSVNKNKIPVFLGIGGILFTVLIYGSLFYFGMVANYGPYHELKKQLTVQLLTQTRGQILIFKERYNKLPESLKELGRPSEENFYSTSDPWMNEFEYKINNDGTFELRSYGPDGIPHNEDDILSSK